MAKPRPVVPRLARRLAPIMAVLVCSAAPARAQRFNREPAPEPVIHNVAYDGRFTFVRLKFTPGPGGFYYRGLPAWAHGYPTAENNLMKILNEISYLRPHVAETNVIALDDPELFKYPVAYMTEAAFWTMTDKEAASFRAYLLKGGFVIFDDFRNYGFGLGAGWSNFEEQMKRVLPEGRFVDLDAMHPIFHSFFEINSLAIIPQFYDRGAPVFRAMFQDNDPKKRLMVMVNFNTDVSNYWEFSAEGFRPVNEANEAYKLGVNYVVYGMTH